MITFRDKLPELMRLLRNAGDDFSANQVEDALTGSHENLRAYLVSNDLWGGAGSIADQGGLKGSGKRDEHRILVEALMIRIGRMQIAMNLMNARTEMWVDAFEQWQKDFKQ